VSGPTTEAEVLWLAVVEKFSLYHLPSLPSKLFESADDLSLPLPPLPRGVSRSSVLSISMPSLDDLPNEVLGNIDIPQRELTNFIRVNRRFYEIFIHKLYATFTFGRDDTAYQDHKVRFSFIATIIKTPLLARQVTTVDLYDDNSYLRALSAPQPGFVWANFFDTGVRLDKGCTTLVRRDRMVSYLLHCLPNVRHLKLAYGLGYAELQNINYSNLRSVDLYRIT
jgi:hypothetical protein